jgi:RimK family alpha-L-glutamate ligase
MEGFEPAEAYARSAHRPLIFKPLFGSQGKGLLRIEGAGELPAPEAADNIYYLQDYVPASGATFEDWRVVVTRNRVVAAMARTGGHWITNVHQGGRPVACSPTPEMAALASAALKAVGADYAGVDLIRAPDGALQVLEVNSNPSWRGLQSVADVDVADAVVEDFLAAVAEHHRHRCTA